MSILIRLMRPHCMIEHYKCFATRVGEVHEYEEVVIETEGRGQADYPVGAG